MKVFNGNIGDINYWCYSENETIAKHVIHDLSIALGKSNDHHRHNKQANYVIAFILGDTLYIARRIFYAIVVSSVGVWYAKGKLDKIPLPKQAVLVLSKEYIDDIPGFVDPEDFCAKISEIPAQHYCIPLNKSIRTLECAMLVAKNL